MRKVYNNENQQLLRDSISLLTLKEPGGGAESAPLDIFCYISAGCYFFALKLHDFFSSSLALDLRPFFKKKIGPRVMTRRCVIERWVQRKTDQKLIFNGNYTQIVFFVFRIHFHYALSYLFGLFGVRTCVSILWHTSLPKMQLLLEKNSEKPWFWRFLVIFVFLTWRHLWCHCDVIQGMFVLFWYQWTREGHTSTTHLMFRQSVSEILGGMGGIRPPPRLWDGSKKPGVF